MFLQFISHVNGNNFRSNSIGTCITTVNSLCQSSNVKVLCVWHFIFRSYSKCYKSNLFTYLFQFSILMLGRQKVKRIYNLAFAFSLSTSDFVNQTPWARLWEGYFGAEQCVQKHFFFFLQMSTDAYFICRYLQRPIFQAHFPGMSLHVMLASLTKRPFSKMDRSLME